MIQNFVCVLPPELKIFGFVTGKKITVPQSSCHTVFLFNWRVMKVSLRNKETPVEEET